MVNKKHERSYHPIIAAILSLIFCGAGQIYLHRITRGIVLVISFWIGFLIIWLAITQKDFKLFTLYSREIMFSPAMKYVSFGKKTIRVTDIMKFTGSVQLIFTWIFSIVDAWKEARS